MNNARITFFREDVWPRLVPSEGPGLGHSRSIGHCWEMRFRTILETRVIGRGVQREGVSLSGPGRGALCLEGLGSGPHSSPLLLLSLSQQVQPSQAGDAPSLRCFCFACDPAGALRSPGHWGAASSAASAPPLPSPPKSGPLSLGTAGIREQIILIVGAALREFSSIPGLCPRDTRSNARCLHDQNVCRCCQMHPGRKDGPH